MNMSGAQRFLPNWVLVADGNSGKANRVVADDINVDVSLVGKNEFHFRYDHVKEESR